MRLKWNLKWQQHNGYHVEGSPNRTTKYNTYLTYLMWYVGSSIHMVIIYMLGRISRKRERFHRRPSDGDSGDG